METFLFRRLIQLPLGGLLFSRARFCFTGQNQIAPASAVVKPALRRSVAFSHPNAANQSEPKNYVKNRRAEDRTRLLEETHRLNVFQIVLGCGAALGYLAFNDLFIRLWLGSAYQAPLAWQAAFAANLVVSACGDAGIQLAARCEDKGLRAAGLAVGGTGLLNLALSILSARLGSVTGIAVATVIAQSVLSLSLGWVACRYLGLSTLRWNLKSWLLPLCAVALALAARWTFPPDAPGRIVALLACYTSIVFGVASIAGLRAGMVRSELAALISIAKGS